MQLEEYVEAEEVYNHASGVITDEADRYIALNTLGSFQYLRVSELQFRITLRSIYQTLFKAGVTCY